MFSTVRTTWSFASSPFWLLWRGYSSLWWAFNTPPKAAAPKVEVDQSRSFDVVDSRPKPEPLPRPIGSLRTGFIVTLAASVVSGVVASGLSGSHEIAPSSALLGWGWVTCVAAVATMYAARRTAIRRAARGPVLPAMAKDAVNAARAGAASAVSAVQGAAKSAGRGAGAFIRRAAGVTERGVRSAYAGAKAAATSPRTKAAVGTIGAKLREVRDAAVRGWKSPVVSHNAPTSKA